MPLPLAEFLALATTCAPNVAPATLAAIVQVESGFNALAIGVNGTPRVTVTASTATDAAARAKALAKDLAKKERALADSMDRAKDAKQKADANQNARDLAQKCVRAKHVLKDLVANHGVK